MCDLPTPRRAGSLAGCAGSGGNHVAVYPEVTATAVPSGVGMAVNLACSFVKRGFALDLSDSLVLKDS